MGKTALITRGPARFYFGDGVVALTLALAGDATLSAAKVRQDLAAMLRDLDYLSLSPDMFDNLDAEGQEAVLVRAVRGRRVLVVFDNYETVPWRLRRDREPSEAPLTDAGQHGEADAVQRLAMRLAEAEVALLFTTRQSPVGLPNEVAYPPDGGQLGGLDPASASALFRRRRPAVRRAPARVAGAVGFSPLAIRAGGRWQRPDNLPGSFSLLAFRPDPQAKVTACRPTCNRRWRMSASRSTRCQ
jgi:hypothetical protein